MSPGLGIGRQPSGLSGFPAGGSFAPAGFVGAGGKGLGSAGGNGLVASGGLSGFGGSGGFGGLGGLSGTVGSSSGYMGYDPFVYYTSLAFLEGYNQALKDYVWLVKDNVLPVPSAPSAADASPIPVPASALMLVAGALGFAAVGRRRKA